MILSFRRVRSSTAILLSIIQFATWYVLSSGAQRPYDPAYGLLRPIDAQSRFAIVTFLGSDTFNAGQDYYYTACRILTYQMLYNDETGIRDKEQVHWIVAVTPSVDQWKRDQLVRDGARVVEVEDVPLRWWIKTGITRWKDTFTKLRVLQWTQYSRVLFVDADSLLNGPIDGSFDGDTSRIPSRTDFSKRRGDEADLPAEYIFLAGQDHGFTGERDHAVPPERSKSTDVFNSGFWLAAPSTDLYNHLVSIMGHFHRFDPTTTDQSLLNYAFRRCHLKVDMLHPTDLGACPTGSAPGPMPWGELDWKWTSTWPSLKDKDLGVAHLHEKLWKSGPQELRAQWEETREAMEQRLGRSNPP
jgi:alpha-N-acetylglucosamine transferase